MKFSMKYSYTVIIGAVLSIFVIVSAYAARAPTIVIINTPNLLVQTYRLWTRDPITTVERTTPEARRLDNDGFVHSVAGILNIEINKGALRDLEKYKWAGNFTTTVRYNPAFSNTISETRFANLDGVNRIDEVFHWGTVKSHPPYVVNREFLPRAVGAIVVDEFWRGLPKRTIGVRIRAFLAEGQGFREIQNVESFRELFDGLPAWTERSQWDRFP